MFLKAGAISLALLLASRLVGLLRESAQAAAFGASGLADAAVLALTLPDWLANLLAGGALAYVLLPHWAAQSTSERAATQRAVAKGLCLFGLLVALVLWASRHAVVGWLAPGLPPAAASQAALLLGWSAAALPAALLASLWATRLQFERDFLGVYGANLLVNATLVAAVAAAALLTSAWQALLLGVGLLLATLLRLSWLAWRLPHGVAERHAASAPAPPAGVWAAASLAAGLPLLLPFAARSLASAAGEGALATFNYAWKLAELPLVLAIQLVASLAFPAIVRAMAQQPAATAERDAATAVRSAFLLAWTLACAAAVGLLVAAPAVAQLLFGWGRMEPQALARIGAWGGVAAWGLLPQALIAVALTVLAARRRMRAAVLAYAAALGALLLAGAFGVREGATLMWLLNALMAGVALLVLVALGPQGRRWLPWRGAAAPLAVLLATAAILEMAPVRVSISEGNMAVALASAAMAAMLTIAAGLSASDELRLALRR